MLGVFAQIMRSLEDCEIADMRMDLKELFVILDKKKMCHQLIFVPSYSKVVLFYYCSEGSTQCSGLFNVLL